MFYARQFRLMLVNNLTHDQVALAMRALYPKCDERLQASYSIQSYADGPWWRGVLERYVLVTSYTVVHDKCTIRRIDKSTPPWYRAMHSARAGDSMGFVPEIAANGRILQRSNTASPEATLVRQLAEHPMRLV